MHDNSEFINHSRSEKSLKTVRVHPDERTYC